MALFVHLFREFLHFFSQPVLHTFFFINYEGYVIDFFKNLAIALMVIFLGL